MELEQRLLTVRQAAKYLGFSEGTLRSKMTQGTMPIKPVRFGQAMRFDIQELDQHIKEGAR